jgi:uncharacterized membrane-anchored protein YitT (DUF2179 family)
MLAILSAGMGIKRYLLSSHFIDDGVTGISMLLDYIFHWPVAILIPVSTFLLSFLDAFSRLKVCDMTALFGVVTRLEVETLKSLIRPVDANAFITQNNIDNIQGGMIKQRGLH